MTPDDSAPEFLNHPRRNRALRSLAGKTPPFDERLIAALAKIIPEPATIEDSHAFATLLADADAEPLIAPLVATISTADPGVTRWLADYLYSLGSLLMNRQDPFPVDEDFVHRLGGWLLTTGGGEISWKAADVLAEVENPATCDYLLRGLADATLFSGTRIACLRGIVNHHRDLAGPALASVADDPDPKIRDAAAAASAFLKGMAG